MAINVTSPSGLYGGRSFMGLTPRNVNRVGTSDAVKKANSILADPGAYAEQIGATLGNNIPEIDVDQGMYTPPRNFGDASQFNYDPTLGTVELPDAPDAPTAQTGYNAASIMDLIQQQGVSAEAAQGQLSSGALIDTNSLGLIDVNAEANADYMTNVPMLDISNVIDTSTPTGKMVAEDLGQFGYVDSKATTLGQLELLQPHFYDEKTGEYKIPNFMAGMANQLKATLGRVGNKQQVTEKLATAMMSSMVTIAQGEAATFAGFTKDNLNNATRSFLQSMQILSQFKVANLDAKTQAAVTNAQSTVRMDVQNLDNRQQANILNATQRFAALFEDAKEDNLAKRFDITNELDREQWYTTLSSNVEMAKAEMVNAMTVQNMNAENSAAQFNRQMEYAHWSYEQQHQDKINQDIRDWKRNVLLTNSARQFDAAMFDAKAVLGINQETLNRVWNRADAQFNYLATASESQKDRDLKMFEMKMEAQLAAMKAKSDRRAALFGAIGNVLGSVAGGMFGSGGMFGASAAAAGGTAAAAGAAGAAAGGSTFLSFLPFLSDAELKTNIRTIGKHSSGLPLYKWDWTDKAIELGLTHEKNVGVMAQEAKVKFPEAVSMHPSGYMQVNYARLR